MTRPTLLALDLATHRLGLCHWRGDRDWEATSIRLTGRLERRLAALGEHVERWLDRVYLPGLLLVVELPDLMAAAIQETTPATLKALYAAYGVVLEVARRDGVAVRAVDARLVRERLTQRPTGSKAEVQQYLERRGFMLPRRGGVIDHDACDALALAVVTHDELVLLAKGVVRA